ncbi:SDR family NAD(P)-dependent oxidoreductase [Cytophagaceae bacterium DM2B3-1]|uniref:SDR family NAD(P)-dependent oxidoreductase n=1 Tax=Xanthocytophaga flava TaxID=3048013 RepID=A0ABT7CLG9_9BACT|nr:SDR family NAD(P)-dependent oxidoreductase [Xanthocytophaga flavus]MDJ1468221.1 SDR family NAD(P)-dependent oxidoreductase [Xanthocytophaga flavus]MDJ1494588.1 SDR family NAD(P)-dependent oxidoreductase [Xanthocytophaga flavus]
MKLSQNTVLITGGASGIGFAFAERFLKAGSQVIICGRREDKLQEVQQHYPQLITKVTDVASESDRLALLEWVKQEHPEVNVLVNNAGIQRRLSLTNLQEDWSTTHNELAINLDAPIHLSTLFIPHLRTKANAVIINVTSGLAFAALANVPIYCATKAALHSFTQSLRYQLAKDTAINVIEVVPPAVNTDLGGIGLHTFGVNLDEFADSIFQRLATDEQEIGFGTSEQIRNASRSEIDGRFKTMNP